jgi:hypothetical protein
MRTEPRAQQRPKPFHRVYVHFMKAISVVIPCVFTSAMTDTLMRIAPLSQAAVDAVFICVHTRIRGNRGLDQRLDRPLLDVFQQPNNHVTTALDHPEDRGLLRGACTASPLTLEPSAPSTPPFFVPSPAGLCAQPRARARHMQPHRLRWAPTASQRCRGVTDASSDAHQRDGDRVLGQSAGLTG